MLGRFGRLRRSLKILLTGASGFIVIFYLMVVKPA